MAPLLLLAGWLCAGTSEATKPLPPVEATWQIEQPLLAGTRVRASLILSVPSPVGRAHVTLVPGPALDRVLVPFPDYDGPLSPQAPLILSVEVLVPEGPLPGLEARIELDGPGEAQAIGAALDLTPESARPRIVPSTSVPAADGMQVVEVATGAPAGAATGVRPGVGPLPRAGTPRPSSGPRSGSAAQIQVSGRFLYRDRVFGPNGFLHASTADDPLRPIRFAALELLAGGAVVATALTDSAGVFSLPLLPQAGVSYQVRVLSSTGAWGGAAYRVLFSRLTPAYYSLLSVSFQDPGGDVMLPDGIAEPGAGEPFNILDACVAGAQEVELMEGNLPTIALEAFWNPGSHTGTYFQRDESVIYLDDDEGYDDSVILHEFGHYVLWNYSKVESPGGIHYINDSKQDPRLSWSEGHASYFQARVRARRGDPYPGWYVDTNGTPGAGQLSFSYDLEHPDYPARGIGSEIVVQALLWDIEDGPNTPGDRSPSVDDDALERPSVESWKVMAGPMRTATTVTLEDFWDGWFSPSVNNGRRPEMEAAFAALGAEFFPDSVEDDAAGPGTPLATDGVGVHRTFYPSGDQDLFRFEAEAGVPVLVETLHIQGYGNTALEVTGPESTWTNDNWIPGQMESAVRFTSKVGGSYTVRVTRSISGSFSRYAEYGAYDVRALTGQVAEPLLALVGSGGSAADPGFGVGTAAADYDGDGRPDLVVVNNSGCGTVKGEDGLYRNIGSLTFESVAVDAGLGGSGGGIAAAWGDYDGDGDPDLFVSDHALYRNNGNGTFTDVTVESGILDMGHEFDAAWVDADGDRRLDLFVVRGNGPPVLWHHAGNRTFVDVSAEAGFSVPANGGNAHACAWADYDNDGDPDCFLALRNNPGHALYRNLGGNRFEDVTQAAGVASEVPAVGGAWGDVNGDGLQDLFVSSDGRDKLYLNQGGGVFVDRAATWGVDDPGPSTGAGFLDADLDGDLDLFVAKLGAPAILYRNLGSGMLPGSELLAPGLGYGVSIGDLDQDGDPEIYQALGCDGNQCGTSCQADRLYRNLAVETKARNWLAVELEGTLSNRSGLGAQVAVHTGAITRWREMGTGNGWASKSLLPVEFGLGEATRVDSVEVFWPSGARNTVLAPRAGHVLRVVESPYAPAWPDPGTAFHFSLQGPAPNPFRVGTSMILDLTHAAPVHIAIYDLAGRRVRNLVERDLGPGTHFVEWNGVDDQGRMVRAGVYFYRVEAEGQTETKKVVMVGG